MPTTQTRRRFLYDGLSGRRCRVLCAPRVLAGEGALETTTVRLPKFSSIFVSPQYAAEELLRAEGFTDVPYVDTPASAVSEAIGHDRLDFGLNYARSSYQQSTAADRSRCWRACMSGVSSCSRRT